MFDDSNLAMSMELEVLELEELELEELELEELELEVGTAWVHLREVTRRCACIDSSAKFMEG